jgi:hypothetical protein
MMTFSARAAGGRGLSGDSMAFQGIRVGIVGLATGALLLTACSSGGASTGTSVPASGGSASAAAVAASANNPLAAEIAAVAVLSTADQEKRLATDSLAAELALLPAGDADAYKAVTSALITQARAYAADTTFGKFGAGPVRMEDAGYGGMLFSSWLLTGLGVSAAVGGSNGAEQGAPAQTFTKKDSSASISSEMTMTGTVETATFDMSMTSTDKDVTGTMHLKGTVNPCPDVGGRFTAKVTADISGASSSEGGNLASTVDISLQGLVDDNADVIGYETTTNTKAKSGSRGQIADVSATIQRNGDTLTVTGAKDNGASGGKAGEAAQWTTLGVLTEGMVVNTVMEGIKKAIESGRCVKLNAPTTPAKTTRLPVSSTVSISAQPRSKVDGKPTGGSVTGTLNGGAALDPASTKVPADATFTYTAPDKEDERATVLLEARSLRGVGKAEIPMDTKKIHGFVIAETVGMYHYEGKVCGSIVGPWTIKYKLEGFPQLKGRGTYSITFPQEPEAGNETASVSGSGTEKGSIVAVGLPGGVRFNAPITAKLTPRGADYTMVITSMGGSSPRSRPSACPSPTRWTSRPST